MDAESQLIEDLEAEIERLKADNLRMFTENDRFRLWLHRRNQLITELCDALEEEFGESKDLMQSQQHPWSIIRQGREDAQ